MKYNFRSGKYNYHIYWNQISSKSFIDYDNSSFCTDGNPIRLEHPRCSVMVEVLDQYQTVQRRLEPYLTRYYNTMSNDPTYQDQVMYFWLN